MFSTASTEPTKRAPARTGGFGLGLAIVKWIAESHNGSVELTHNPGPGTTFTVTLAPLIHKT